MALKILYLAVFFLSFIELCIYFEITSNKINKNYLILFVTTIISNFGYSMLTFASSLEAAMCGDLLSYIGSIFTIMFMLVVVVDMCGKKFYIPLRLTLLAVSVIISIIFATTRDTNLFFDHPYMVQEHGISLVKYSMGPVMHFYMVYLAVINLSAIGIVIHTILTKKRVSKTGLKILLCVLICGTLLYVIPLAFGASINLMPFIYVSMETFFMYISSRASIYDIPGNLMAVYNSRDGYGYIAFDSKKRFLGCDDFAVCIFPELHDISIDSTIPSSCKQIYEGLHYKDESWNWDDNCNKISGF